MRQPGLAEPSIAMAMMLLMLALPPRHVFRFVA
jgi:hypothetical protein